jgi:putative DNA methylase
MKSDRSKSHGFYRRRLPHFTGEGLLQFVTFRLADSVPAKLIERWKVLVDVTDPETSVSYRKKIERYLDRAYGECFLRQRKVAELVSDSLFFHNGKKYQLIAWVIMPNHVHLLLLPLAEIDLEEIMHSIKSYTAPEINKLLGRTGQVWAHESFDRYIRNEAHRRNVIRYIEMNPVKARLCLEPEDFEFSSAYYAPEV